MSVLTIAWSMCAAASFVLVGGVHTPLVDAGIVETPNMVSYVNPCFERLSGYSSQELVGTPATRLMPNADAAELEHRLSEAAATGPRPHSQL